MKTVYEYEAADIDVKNNKVHQMVSLGLMLAAISMKGRDEETPEQMMARVTALFLTMLSKSGIALVDEELHNAVKQDIAEQRIV